MWTIWNAPSCWPSRYLSTLILPNFPLVETRKHIHQWNKEFPRWRRQGWPPTAAPLLTTSLWIFYSCEGNAYIWIKTTADVRDLGSSRGLQSSLCATTKAAKFIVQAGDKSSTLHHSSICFSIFFFFSGKCRASERRHESPVSSLDGSQVSSEQLASRNHKDVRLNWKEVLRHPGPADQDRAEVQRQTFTLIHTWG